MSKTFFQTLWVYKYTPAFLLISPLVAACDFHVQAEIHTHWRTERVGNCAIVSPQVKNFGKSAKIFNFKVKWLSW